jgi:outer membrane protein OmpU
MKKLLLTTTALVLGAGVAAADVTLSGDGRFGLIYNGKDTAMSSRARVTFTLTGDTDGGLAFGGSFRADNASNAAAGRAGNIFISGDFGKLAFGDVDTAAMNATGDLHGVGFSGVGGLANLHQMEYVGRVYDAIDATLAEEADAFFPATVTGTKVVSGLNSLPRALYTYSVDGFTVYASVGRSVSRAQTVTANYEIVPDVTIPVSVSVKEKITATELSIGASYTLDGLMVAAGYENLEIKFEDGDKLRLGHATVALGYTMDGITVKAIVGQAMNDLKDIVETKTQYGLSASGKFDAVTVTAFGRRDFSKDQHVGLGVAYDLGGGAAVRAGVVNTNFNATGKKSLTQADAGLTFRF